VRVTERRSEGSAQFKGTDHALHELGTRVFTAAARYFTRARSPWRMTKKWLKGNNRLLATTYCNVVKHTITWHGKGGINPRCR
jgi:hypothetical protein